MPDIRLPYGIDNFAKVRAENCYYVDKTGFIGELLEEQFDVNLITRPRRFGKTLTMSMLAEFFDIRKDSAAIFEGLEVTKDTVLCSKWRNQWPVLFLTLKDVEGRNFDKAYGLLKQVVSKLCMEHSYLLESTEVKAADRESFSRLMFRRGDDTDVQCALDTLLRMMKAHYGKEVIFLVDEYDVPLAKAGDNGYYEEMLDVIRSFLGMTWKGSPFLKFAVVTGCLRLAKESIFTGANNFISNSVSDEQYNRYFGFTEDEVSGLLKDAGLPEKLAEIKVWYDGYRFGGKEIYCPWDVINHVRALLRNPQARPGNYWLDTSHNEIVRKFIELPNLNVNHKFETLLAGGVVWEPVRENLTYERAYSSEDNLWSILYLTGYLTQADSGVTGGGKSAGETTALCIPNEEVKSVFGQTVKKWFEEQIQARDRRTFFREWWNGEDGRLTQEVSDILFDTISYFDYKEDYYHAFVTGLFSGAGYEVKSNSEQGTGRADIIVKEQRHRRALVIEVKWPNKGADLEKECREALGQIREKQYARQLRIEGYKTILCYGAAFLGKECVIKVDPALCGADVEL